MHIETAQNWLKAGAAVLVGFGLLGPIGALTGHLGNHTLFCRSRLFPARRRPGCNWTRPRGFSGR